LRRWQRGIAAALRDAIKLAKPARGMETVDAPDLLLADTHHTLARILQR
jgi:hypothetical protein